MKSKCLLGIGLVMGAFGAGHAAMADSIVLYQNSYSFLDAGEFTADTSSQNFLGSYVPATIVNGGFETFCVEASVYFQPGDSYNYTLSNTDSQGRNLTEGAAFLYSQFALGTLSGYDYSNAANRNGDAGKLQAAIWYLQGGQSGGNGFAFGGAGNPFYDLAVSNLGSNHILTPNDGLFSVQILELWDPANNAHQNQLVLNPFLGAQIPESSSFSLLAFGLAVACFTHQRIRRSQPVPVPCKRVDRF
jgi:hypothetical protein